ERTFEADIRAEMGEAAGQLRRVEEHRKWPLNRSAALDYRIESRSVLGSDLILARDGHESRHDDILRHREVRHGRIRQMLCSEKLGPTHAEPRVAGFA